MKKIKFKLGIEISGIEVEETSTNQGWYKFDYILKVNNGRKKLGTVDGSWSSQTKKNLKSSLTRGFAVNLVIQRYYA